MATLYVLYGSATGNAEGIAKDLAERRPLPAGFASVVCEPMERFKKLAAEWSEDPAESSSGNVKHGVLLVVSTTGNGEAPENASRFVRFLKRKNNVQAKPYVHVAYAVLGLGDSNYDIFCATGKTVDRQMALMGATRAKPLVCADEATGLEEAVEPWTASVFNDIAEACAPSTLPAPVRDATQAQSETNRDGTNGRTLGSDAIPQSQLQTASVEPSAGPVQPVEHVQPVDKADTPLFILYGSATGNAEHIAKDLASTYELILGNPDAKCFFPSVVCCPADQFKKLCQPHWDTEPPPGTKHGVLVVTSTTGNGDAPENINRFARYLKRKNTVQAQPFRHCAYAVLGLGDTNYDQFCQTGKVVDKQIKLLGGTRAKPLACADEATGLEDVVDPWCHTIFMDITNACKPKVAQYTSTTDTASQTPSTVSNPTYKATIEEEEEKKMDVADTNETPTPSSVAGTDAAFGVRVLRSLLALDPKAVLPTVPDSSLPSLLKSRSSCELVNDETDLLGHRDRSGSFSSVSSGGMMYTYKSPYESSILSARYLTSTSSDAASKIVHELGHTGIRNDRDLLVCQSILDDQFQLGAASRKVTAEDLPAAAVARNSKRVVEMTVSLPDDSTLEYQPGDSLGLIVPNASESVTYILDMIQRHHKIKPAQKILIDGQQNTTVDEAVRYQFNLSTPIKHKRTLLNLSCLATDPNEAAVLRYLSAKEGDEIYKQYVVGQRKTIVGLLQDFPSCQGMSLESLFSLLPMLPPRYYSVASSPFDQRTGSPSLTVAYSVVDYVTPSLQIDGEEAGKRRIHGTATRYLEALCSPCLCGSKNFSVPPLKIFPKPTADFRLPVSHARPIVLIGPGTGIAPFMGFLAHRQAAMKNPSAATYQRGFELDSLDAPADSKDAGEHGEFGSIDVYFGCRHEDHDWLYKDEMKRYEQDGIVTKLYTVFSRDGHSNRYVQDIMRGNQEATDRLLDIMLRKKGVVYICGDGTHMARDVQMAIAEILGKELGGVREGMKAVSDMKDSGHLLLDIWA